MTSVPCDWQRAGNKSYANPQHEHTRVNICLFKSGWYTLGKLIIWCDFGITSQLTVYFQWCNKYVLQEKQFACFSGNAKLCSRLSIFLLPQSKLVERQIKGLSVTPFCHQSFVTQMRCQTVELPAKECTTAVSFLQPNQVTSYLSVTLAE